jgi:S1-C subfamily serine protease
VTGVIENSPAARAGLLERDVITHADGKVIRDVNSLRNTIAMMRPGKKAAFKVNRDGKTRTFMVKIGQLEEKKPQKPDRKKSFSNFGLTLENIHDRHIYEFGLKIKEGVIVTRVEMGSRGDKAGIRPGDVILRVGETAVTSVNKFRKAVKSHRKGAVVVAVDRQGVRLFLGLKLK